MVYVQDINGKPMMPTTRYGKVRRLLKDKKAIVVNLCPFTIKLMYVTSDYKQEIVLGVDAGTKHVGLSATTKSKELYSSEVILRNDIVDLLSTRRELRKTRRNRLRYGIAHKNRSVQGFLTSKNRFLTREEASELVKSNNQEMVVDRNAIREQLYSEDLY